MRGRGGYAPLCVYVRLWDLWVKGEGYRELVGSLLSR